MKKSWLILSLIVIIALVAFNYLNTNITYYSLTDLLGNLSLGPVRWALILTVAFAGIDFTGIARLFSGRNPQDTPLLIAWFVAAFLNAVLVWWGFSVSQIGLGHSPMIPIITAAIMLIVRVAIIMTSGLIGEINRPRFIVKGLNPSVEHFTMSEPEIPYGRTREKS